MHLRSAVEHIRACELFSNASFDIAYRNRGFPDFHLQIKLNTRNTSSLEKPEAEICNRVPGILAVASQVGKNMRS